MQRKTAHDFDQELLILFDAYVHGLIDRRGFLDKAAKYAVGGVTAAMLLDQLNPKFAEAQVVKPDDPRIKVGYVEYDSPGGSGKMRGYQATGKLPAIVVIHENRGLNPHIEDIARRLALDNFIAFAPDALTPLGGYPGDEDRARELFQKIDPRKAMRYPRVPPDNEPFQPLSRIGTGTTSFAVADADGNMIAVTQTLSTWGGTFYVSKGLGFLYNNHLRSSRTTPAVTPPAGSMRRSVGCRDSRTPS